MSFKKRGYTTIVSQAKKNVVNFSTAYQKLIERVTVDQNIKSIIRIMSFDSKPTQFMKDDKKEKLKTTKASFNTGLN